MPDLNALLSFLKRAQEHHDFAASNQDQAGVDHYGGLLDRANALAERSLGKSQMVDQPMEMATAAPPVPNENVGMTPWQQDTTQLNKPSLTVDLQEETKPTGTPTPGSATPMQDYYNAHKPQPAAPSQSTAPPANPQPNWYSMHSLATPSSVDVMKPVREAVQWAGNTNLAGAIGKSANAADSLLNKMGGPVREAFSQQTPPVAPPVRAEAPVAEPEGGYTETPEGESAFTGAINQPKDFELTNTKKAYGKYGTPMEFTAAVKQANKGGDPFEDEFLKRVEREVGKKPQFFTLENLAMLLLMGAPRAYSSFKADQQRYDTGVRAVAAGLRGEKHTADMMAYKQNKDQLDRELEAKKASAILLPKMIREKGESQLQEARSISGQIQAIERQIPAPEPNDPRIIQLTNQMQAILRDYDKMVNENSNGIVK